MAIKDWEDIGWIAICYLTVKDNYDSYTRDVLKFHHGFDLPDGSSGRAMQELVKADINVGPFVTYAIKADSDCLFRFKNLDDAIRARMLIEL